MEEQSTPATQTASGGTTSKEEVLDLQRQRMEAMVKRDIAQLNRLMADELTYTHTTGRVDTKSQLIASIESGRLKYESMEPEEVDVRLYGSTALVTGTARVRVVTQQGPTSFAIRFLDVYASRNGQWQAVAWQSTRLPD